MLLSRRFKESFKLALAIVLAYGIALSMNWEKPMWAAFAVAVMGLAGAGQSFHKGAMRLLGTLLAILVSLTLLGLFPQDRWWLMLVLSAFVGLCTYALTGGSGRSYFWQVAGFVSVIICMESIPQTDHGFDIAVLRTLETGLGVLCYTLVSMLVWPVSSAGELGAAARSLAATQHRLFRGYLELLAGRTNKQDLQALRMQQVQQIGQLGAALASARSDSYTVWELRRQWDRLAADAQAVMEALERWRESFSDLGGLDLPRLMPNITAFGNELDARLGQIERILGGAAPERMPQPLKLELDLDAARALSHFDRAALALARSQLESLEALTRSLCATIADIKGQAVSAPPSSAPAPARGRWLPDRDRLAAAVQVMVGLWAAYLIWLYLEVPGGVTIVILAGSLGMGLAAYPQLPIKIVYKPAAVAVAFSAGVYIFVLPRLSGFTELAVVIFGVTFAIAYLFHQPRQIIGRTLGLMMFATLTGISNEQTYSVLQPLDIALALALVLTLLSFVAHIPHSPRPEQAFRRLLRRFFRSCDFLVSTLDQDPDRPATWLERWRRAYHEREVATLPKKIAMWQRALAAEYLAGAPADRLTLLSDQIQALAYRMQDTLQARSVAGWDALEHELRAKIHAWRAGLQQVFGNLALHPDAEGHADLRARLDTKLERMEAQIEAIMNRADNADISPREAEATYRLLGAHRGLSEAIVAFARQAPAIDWSRLSEARF